MSNLEDTSGRSFEYAVIGGGIAGVSCVEQILELEPEAQILLVSTSPVVKEVSNVTRLTKTLQDFIIVEKSLKSFRDVHQSVCVMNDSVSNLNPSKNVSVNQVNLFSGYKVEIPGKVVLTIGRRSVPSEIWMRWVGTINRRENLFHYLDFLLVTKNNGEFQYGKLCICTGASPKVMFPHNEYVVGIRDTESVEELTQRLTKARRVILIGNGGIATELVYELEGVDIIWCVKDSSISAHYLDSGAAEFFVQCKMQKSKNTTKDSDSSSASIESGSKSRKRVKYELASQVIRDSGSSTKSGDDDNLLEIGSALGPDWHEGFSLKGLCEEKNVTIEYETECKAILSPSEYDEFRKASSTLSSDNFLEKEEWPVYAQLTNEKVYGCDLIISATGVRPNCDWFLNVVATAADNSSHIKFDPELGIPVNCRMETDLKDIYACGDVCFANWTWSRHWFQMRLWTQARQMGLTAGKSMFEAIEASKKPDEEKPAYHPCDDEPEFVFEIFSHVTRFFGFKVVLLGLYNAQGLEKGSFEYLLRYTKNLEYIKVVLQDSRMKGAILIGDTGLEETFENLILNQLDLSAFGEDLLNPDIDIEDYFD